MNPTRPNPAAARWPLVALMLAALFAFFAPEAVAKPRCNGKKATIVSNAPRIVGGKAPDVIVAGGRDNVIFGEGGNDLICAGGGDDTVFGGRGKDTLQGQGGDDALHAERGSDRLHGGGGEDSLFGETGNDQLDGGAGNGDRVNAGPGDDTLEGGPGDFDVLVGAPGNDKIDGGAGAHDVASFAGTGGAVTVDLQGQTVGGAEGERMQGIEDAVGGSGHDTLVGDAGSANRLDGGPGGDRLVAGGPGDEALGGPGSDQCSGGFAGEVSCGSGQVGGVGTIVELYASIDGQTSLIVTGSEGSDAVQVSHSAGTFTVQRAAGGAAVFSGDPTSAACTTAPDVVSCSGRVTSILASLGGGNDSFQVGESVPSDVFSIVDGGEGSDSAAGGRGDDVFYGGDDRDPDGLEGGGGDDVLYGVNIFHPRKDSGAARMIGGPGNDLMIGGQPCGGDLYDGGPGSNDSASFARVKNGGIVVQATIGGAVLDPDVSGCNAGRISSGVEKIEGSTGPDILDGDGTANVLLGRGGNDRLDGRGGNDSCVGGGGRDRGSGCEGSFSIP